MSHFTANETFGLPICLFRYPIIAQVRGKGSICQGCWEDRAGQANATIYECAALVDRKALAEGE